MQTGRRWGDHYACIDSIKNKVFTKIESGSKIEIEVC